MIKRTVILAAAAAAAAMATGARAADLPMRVKAQPYEAPSLFTWTGFYGGVNVGYKFDGDDDVNTQGQAAPNIANIAGGARPGFVPLNRDGFVGGVQAGYNYQVGQFVAGVEADIDYLDSHDSNTVVTSQLVTGLPLANTFSSRLEYLGTVRGRLGYAYDRVLFYATGGFAYGQSDHSVNMLGAASAGDLQFSGRNNQLKTGYAVGVGVEYALTNHLTIRGEYLFYDLGSDTVNVAVIPNSGGAGTGYNSHFDDNGHILRVGLNYKIN
jgi:outer membrane immunogenic protein